MWNFTEYVVEDSLYNQTERIEYGMFQFIENFFPIFVQEQIRTVTEDFVAVVQIVQLHLESERRKKWENNQKKEKTKWRTTRGEAG